MAHKFTEKQKNTLWQQRRLASYQASCALAGYSLPESAIAGDLSAERLDSLRRQYGAE